MGDGEESGPRGKGKGKRSFASTEKNRFPMTIYRKTSLQFRRGESDWEVIGSKKKEKDATVAKVLSLEGKGSWFERERGRERPASGMAKDRIQLEKSRNPQQKSALIAGGGLQSPQGREGSREKIN